MYSQLRSSASTHGPRRCSEHVAFEIAGYRVDGDFRPPAEHSGDFFGVVSPRSGELRVLLGDACGNGPTAARIVDRIRPRLGRILAETATPGEALATLNAECHRALPDDVFVTATCCHIDARAGVVTSSSAGHVPVLLCRSVGSPVLFGHASGPPLGTMRVSTYSNQSTRVDDGDVLLLMTDGVLEALEPAARLAEMRSVRRIVAERSGGRGAQIADHLTDHLTDHLERLGDERGGADATFLALDLPGRDASPRASCLVAE